MAALVREGEDGAPMPLIGDRFTSRAVDLLNAVYEVILATDQSTRPAAIGLDTLGP